MAAMLLYSLEKNFDYFFCLGQQHGRYVYCLFCVWGLCKNQGYEIQLYPTLPSGDTIFINTCDISFEPISFKHLRAVFSGPRARCFESFVVLNRAKR